MQAHSVLWASELTLYRRCLRLRASLLWPRETPLPCAADYDTADGEALFFVALQREEDLELLGTAMLHAGRLW